ncbi:MAG: hypothetical protein IT203_08035 [Fimbriimonadaceae bacterium]|nr:hypothetical protein [Fimbriimonadaceae bacterium]
MKVEGEWHPRSVVEQLFHGGKLAREVEYSYERTVPFKDSYRNWAGWEENALVITDHGEYLYQGGSLVPDPRYADAQKGKLLRRLGLAAAIFLFVAIPFGLVVRARRMNQI